MVCAIGWRIAPAGRHLSIGDLPLAMTLSPDGQSLIDPTLTARVLDRLRNFPASHDELAELTE